MRYLTIPLLFSYFYLVFAKNNLKSLTESMGQEVIEIGAPLKELPQGLEEEPSAENDDDITTTTIQAATRKEIKKNTPETRRKGKDIDKIDGVKQEDEERRIEKELAEIYRDNADYKGDSGELSKETTQTTTTAATVGTEKDDKLIARQRDSFKFQPDVNNKAEVERFRTSVDEISCDRSVTQKLDIKTDNQNTAFLHRTSLSLIYLLLTLVICI